MSGGQSEQGVFGDTYDKYGSRNPFARLLVRGFTRRLEGYVDRAAPTSVTAPSCSGAHAALTNRGDRLRR